MTSPRAHTLLVGGTRGIGRTLARRLALGGHPVTVLGRRPPAEEMAGVHTHVLDVLDLEAVDAAFKAASDLDGPFGQVVFLQRYRGSDDAWEGELATSLTATKNLLERVAPQLPAGSSVVLVSSVASRLVAENQPAGYHVAKAGLEAMVRYYAVTLGPRGVRVNGVSPCTMIKEESAAYYASNQRLRDAYGRMTPLGRMGTAEEVAAVIEFLLGPQASFVTGQTLVVDGGLTLHLQDAFGRNLLAIP